MPIKQEKIEALQPHIPVVGGTYKYFDDGKVKDSRMFDVTITELIPFSAIDENTLSAWKQEVRECSWLYAKETDYFVLGDLQKYDEVEKVVFVRTLNGGWFSIGWWSGRLDIDGSLYEVLTEG